MFFTGAVPAGIIFDCEVSDLCDVAKPLENKKHNEVTAKLCFIGLVAYFEAFCKDHFASLINIHPDLVRNLIRRNLALSPVDPLELSGPLHCSLGFMVADRFDFGTAGHINSLYTDLLKITPFCGDEANTFDQINEDRHLLVHYGGILRPRYSSERFIKRPIDRSRLFLDSLIVSSDQFFAATNFMTGISKKIRSSTQDALRQEISSSGRSLSEHEEKAVDALNWILGTPIEGVG
jgi:hypothetical protein